MDKFWQRMFNRLYVEPGFRVSENGVCMLYQGCSRDKDKYGRMRFNVPGIGQKQTSVSRMAKMIEQRVLDLGANDVSHLCHNKLCIYTPHLNLESSLTNNARKSCVTAHVCSRHPRGDGTFHPDCLLTLKI